MLDRQISRIIRNGIIEEAERLRDANDATGLAYDAIMSNRGDNDIFLDCEGRAAQLYIISTDNENANVNLDDAAYQCACDAFQFYAAYIASSDARVEETLTDDELDKLYALLDAVNADIAEYDRRYGRRQGGGNRPRGNDGYGNRQRQSGYGNRPRQNNRPRSNGIPSGNHGNYGGSSNRRYGNRESSTGANIGRSGGGLGPISRIRNEMARQEQIRNEPPVQEAPPRHLRHTASPNNIRMGQTAASLRSEVPPPPPQQSNVMTTTMIQKNDRRPSYNPTKTIAPTLYDGRKHLPICTIENGETVDERIISKTSLDGQEIMSKIRVPHEDYLFIPRNGVNKESSTTSDESVASLEKLLNSTPILFSELDDQLIKGADGSITAKPDAKLPEGFNKRIIEIDDALHGETTTPAVRMYRVVSHVNSHLTALNPDTDYSKLLVSATVVDEMPFSIDASGDVDRILKMLDLVKSRRNIATCLQVVTALNEMISPRAWNLINDQLTLAVNKIGIIDFALPEPIHSFADDIVEYGGLVSKYFGQEIHAKLNEAVVGAVLAVLNPNIGTNGSITFSQRHQVLLLQVQSCDLNFNSVTANMTTGVISEVVFPDLYRGLRRQLDTLEEGTASLVMYTRDGTAIEVRHSPIGDSITLTLI